MSNVVTGVGRTIRVDERGELEYSCSYAIQHFRVQTLSSFLFTTDTLVSDDNGGGRSSSIAKRTRPIQSPSTLTHDNRAPVRAHNAPQPPTLPTSVHSNSPIYLSLVLSLPIFLISSMGRMNLFPNLSQTLFSSHCQRPIRSYHQPASRKPSRLPSPLLSYFLLTHPSSKQSDQKYASVDRRTTNSTSPCYRTTPPNTRQTLQRRL
ncbi:hypothetical protein F5887DRAFT_1076569 [Amanita rubescens]|nr:hypothetical protein F5887DRAFT_1076569 [Amanita rubescens]